MLRFELKKLLRRRYLWILILGSFFIVSFHLFSLRSAVLVQNNQESSISTDLIFLQHYRSIVERFQFRDEMEYLVKQVGDDRSRFGHLSETLRKIRGDSMEKGRTDGDQAKRYVDAQYQSLREIWTLIEKYDRILTPEQSESLEWSFLSRRHMLETGRHQVDLRYAMNLGRFLRFRTSEWLGISALILLIFLGSDVMAGDLASGTFVLLATQPKTRWRIVLAKILSGGMIALIYAVVCIGWMVVWCVALGIPLSGLRSISRVISDEFLYIETWQYAVLSIVGFALIVTSLYGLMVALGARLRKVMPTLILSLLAVLVLQVATSAGYLQSIWNPMYLLEYERHLLGLWIVPFLISSDTIYRRWLPSGILSYAIPLGYACVAYSIACVSLKRESRQSTDRREIGSSFTFPRFEWRKIVGSYSYSILVVSTLFLFGFIYATTALDDWKMTRDSTGSEGTGMMMQAALSNMERDLQRIGEEIDRVHNNEKRNLLKIAHSDAEKALDLQKRMLQNYTDFELSVQQGERAMFCATLPFEVERAFQYRKGYANRLGEVSEFAYRVSMARAEELKKRGIAPFFGSARMETVYDVPSDPVRGAYLRRHQDPITHSGLYSLYRLDQNYFFSFLIFGMALLFFSGGYTYDKEGGQKLSMMLVQPVPRRRFYFAKAWTSLVGAILFLFSVYALILVLGAVTEGFGDPNFPILHYDAYVTNPYVRASLYEGTFHFMDLSVYVVRTLLLSMFVLGFLMALSLLLSMGVRRRQMMVPAVGFVTGAGMWLCTQPWLGSLRDLLPFTYMWVGKIVDGSQAILLRSPRLSVELGMAVLAVWTLVLLILGTQISEQMEVRS